MFNGAKYITKNANELIPVSIQNLLWYAIEKMNISEKDYLQVFELVEVIHDGNKKQKIIHFQEQPEFRDEFIVNTNCIITEKIYVIDSESYSTMLLASEY